MTDSNTVTLGALALIPLVLLAYRIARFTFEKPMEEGIQRITMDFHPPAHPPEISQPQTEKVIYESTEINDSPISLPQPSSSTPLIEPESLKFWQRLPKFLRLRN
jgi:hypothetical protein